MPDDAVVDMGTNPDVGVKTTIELTVLSKSIVKDADRTRLGIYDLAQIVHATTRAILFSFNQPAPPSWEILQTGVKGDFVRAILQYKDWAEVRDRLPDPATMPPFEIPVVRLRYNQLSNGATERAFLTICRTFL